METNSYRESWVSSESRPLLDNIALVIVGTGSADLAQRCIAQNDFRAATLCVIGKVSGRFSHHRPHGLLHLSLYFIERNTGLCRHFGNLFCRKQGARILIGHLQAGNSVLLVIGAGDST
jgi:hypothetical protein